MKIETDTFHFPASFAADMPRLPPATSGENEFAAFAAQFAHRAERLHHARGSEPWRHAVEPVTDAETRHTAELWAGGLLLTGLAVASLFVWEWRSAPATSSPADTAKVESAAPPPPIEARQPATTIALPPVDSPAPAPEPSQVASTPGGASTTPATPVTPSPPATPGGAAPSPAVAPLSAAVDNLVAAATQPTATPPKAPVSTPLSLDEARELQSRLKSAGFDPGPIDGIVGPRTTDAAHRYGNARTLANADPAREMLVRLRAEPAQSAGLPPH
jgi:hypothetical protein